MKKISKIITSLILGLGLIFSGCNNQFTATEYESTVSARSAVSGWSIGTSYKIGDTVSYNGKVYECLLAHTAITGWYPDVVPALWKYVSADTSGTNTGNSTDDPVVPPENNEDPSTGEDEPVTVPGLPTHILTGYWQNFNNGAKVLRISEVPAEYNLIVVSFADATEKTGEVTFNLDGSLGFDETVFIADIKTVQKRGQHVIISVGGEKGNVTIASSSDAKRFSDSVKALMKKYGFEGVDIDLEHGLNPEYVAEALRALPKGSIITFAPQTIDMQNTGTKYFELALAVKDILTVNNTQYYNSGSMLGYDGNIYYQGSYKFLTELAKIQLKNGLRADQVGIGVPASVKGASSGYVDPSVVIQALDVLCKDYPTIRGAMTWSINWDASNNWNFSKKIGAKLKAMNEASGSTETPVIDPEDPVTPPEDPVTPPEDPVTPPEDPEIPEAGETVKATGIPGTPAIEQSKWNGDATFGIKMNMWWGNNGTLAKLYENGKEIQSTALTDNSPNAQSYVFNLTDKPNGTYAYVVKLTNKYGTVTSNTVNYTVTQGTASTQTPVVIPEDPVVIPEDPVVIPEDPVVIEEPGEVVINKSLPKRIMSGYWHTWNAGVPYIRLKDVDPAWDVINVSFAVPVQPGSGDGKMMFEVVDDDATFISDIKTLQAKGKKIVLSIGGYEGYFYLENSNSVKTFVNDIKGFIDKYGFDGIDIDLEQSSVSMNSGADPDFAHPKTPRIVNMINAIRQICDSYGDDFILSWAPETFYMQLGHTYYGGINSYVDSRAGGYLAMIYALRDKTTYVQTQLYNSSSIQGNDGKWYTMGTEEGIVEMCKMLMDGFYLNGGTTYFWPGLRPDQVVIAVPSSSSAAGSGQISNSGLQNAFKKLEKDYPGIRGFMAWSVNWDAYQNNNSFVRENRSFLNKYQ